MKIAIICSSFFPVIDGVTIAVFNRIKQLSSLGHQAIVFCPDYEPLKQIYPDYQQYTGEILPGINIINLASTKSLVLDFERDVTIKSYPTVVKELNRFQPDIIHVDEAERLGVCWLKLPGVKYARQNNIPCVAWFHTNYLEYIDDYFKLPLGINRLIKSILGWIFAKIYNSYDKTLVSSSVTAAKLKKLGIRNILCANLLGYEAANLNFEQKNLLNRKYNVNSVKDKVKLIFLGRLTPDKGWHFTWESLAKLPPEIWAGIAIIIAGDGTLKNKLEQELKQLLPDVYLLGRVKPEDILNLLINSDIFVTNSEKETRGLTLIEAAAAGIPAIAPRAGGVIDTIKDKETGLLYESQNQQDFLDKLTLLIADAELRQSMGIKAKKLAQQWTWEETVNNLLEIWSQEIARF